MKGQTARDRIAASPFFDAGWYLKHYVHVDRAGQDAATHYLLVGSKVGYDPGPEFSTTGYLAANPDVARAGMNPLLHYEQLIRQEKPGALNVPVEQSMPASELPTIASRLLAMREGTAPGLGFARLADPAARAPGKLVDYAILTPTGDRPAAFNRCLNMVTTQSMQPREWIIVDDGVVPLMDRILLPDWATYVRRTPHSSDPPHSLSVNLPMALEHVTSDRVLIFEDDDWYAPLYAEYLLPHLEQADLVGLNHIHYYLLRAAMWKTGTPPNHTAFAQSAFRRGHAWAHLVAVCETGFPEVRERGVLDRYWWQSFEGSKSLIADHPDLHVGLKGGFGRMGLAEGHKPGDPGYIPDPDSGYLRGLLGPDIAHYQRWQTDFRKPYVLYTSITGTQAPPVPPEGAADHCDLYAFCDRPLPEGCPWQAIPFDAHGSDAALRAAKPAVLPHLYFPDYAWSVWTPSDAPVPADPASAVARAIEARAPLACIGRGPEVPLVRRHCDPQVARAMTLWWQKGLARGGLAVTDLEMEPLKLA